MMLTTTKQVGNFEFGFVFGDINGADGLVIPTYVGLQNPEVLMNQHGFQEALAEAYMMAHVFSCICFLDETAQITDYATLSINQLENLIITCQMVQEQSRWSLAEFGSETIKRVQSVSDDCHIEIRKRENKPKQPAKASRTISGYVYLLQSPTGNYKIGRTVNPQDRMRTFSVKLPFEVEYVCVIPTDDMFALERELHTQFDNKRVNGEWFCLTPADVKYIKGLAK